MGLNYDKAYKYLEQYAIENDVKHFEIVEDSYEYEDGLMLIAYHDEKHEYEDFHHCVDVATI